jgi:iron complex transport system permease protein
VTGSRWPWLFGVAALSLLLGVAIGSVPIRPGAVWDALARGTGPDATIVRDLRLPRALLGFLVGGSLAVCGAVLQALLRNPLADPYLLGLSGGAALGAVTAIALGLTAPWAVPLAAFAGAIAALALVFRISLAERRRVDAHILVLAGVVVSAFTGALVGALLALSDAARLRNAFLWMLGGLGNASWPAVGVFTVYAIGPLAALSALSRELDLVAQGEETARYLGGDPDRVKRVAVAATGLLTAAAVATCGMIGFVGLVVPHAVRLLWGPLHRSLLPSVFLLGGAFLVMADALARTVARPLELPVGVVTALVGVPLFAAVLRRSLA